MIGPLLKREIESTFNVVQNRSTDSELVIVCPECGDHSGNRAINLKTGKTACWRCGKGHNNKGHFLSWAKALGYQFLSDDGYVSVPVGLILNEEERRLTVPIIQEVKLPPGFTPIARRPDSVYTELITKMARRKNLTYDDFVEAGAGYTLRDPRWEPYAIFPVREYNICAYYQGRTYVDAPGETTKRFPNRKEVQWGAGYWVYNIDAVREQKPEIVVVVESILNVLSLRWKFRELGWNSIVPVCVFKHRMSQVQAIKLLQCSGIKEFCFLFDHDAIQTTWRTVGYLSNKMSITVAEMPLKNDNEKLDPNDDVEAAIDVIERREVYTAWAARARMLEKPVANEFAITGRRLLSS